MGDPIREHEIIAEMEEIQKQPVDLRDEPRYEALNKELRELRELEPPAPQAPVAKRTRQLKISRADTYRKDRSGKAPRRW